MHEQLKQPVSLANYFETMSKAIFQTGISWKVVDAKWPGIRDAMKGFDPLKVSKFGGADIDRLMQDTRLIRNRRKLEGIVLNARKMLELDKEYKGFRTYLRSLGTFEETAAALHRDFKFMGESGAYYFLWVVGEKVPPWEEWSAARAYRGHLHLEEKLGKSLFSLPFAKGRGKSRGIWPDAPTERYLMYPRWIQNYLQVYR